VLTVECLPAASGAKAPPLLSGIEVILGDSASSADIE
jgi:hypothetical protein